MNLFDLVTKIRHHNLYLKKRVCDKKAPQYLSKNLKFESGSRQTKYFYHQKNCDLYFW